MSKLVNDRSLMQPFLPGTPGGRGRGGHGESKRVSDDNWKNAFPDCQHNETLGSGPAGWSYDAYMLRFLPPADAVVKLEPEIPKELQKCPQCGRQLLNGAGFHICSDGEKERVTSDGEILCSAASPAVAFSDPQVGIPAHGQELPLSEQPHD